MSRIDQKIHGEMNTEIISYGEHIWSTTPRKKAAWDNFWRKLLAQTERERYTSQVHTENT